MQALLTNYGYDSAKLQNERALIQAYDAANRNQEQFRLKFVKIFTDFQIILYYHQLPKEKRVYTSLNFSAE